MSEIFNFLLLNNNQVEHIYIFKGSIVVNEGENLGPTGKNIVPKEIWNYISNLNVPNENGISANDGIGTFQQKISTTNIKLGVRAGNRVYFRFELGYGLGSIPSEINILATSASLGITENVTEPFPDIPGLSSAGVIIGNIGFGIAF